MPLYDYLHGTLDEDSDMLHEQTSKGEAGNVATMYSAAIKRHQYRRGIQKQDAA